MKIVDAGSIELDKEAPVIVDAGSIELDKPDRPDAALSWRQGADPSVLDRVTNLFSDPEKEKARAVNAIVDAEALSIRPDVAYRYKSAIDKYYQIRPENIQRRQRVYDDIKRFNDMGGTEDEWQTVLWKNARQVPYQMQIAAGGIMRMFEENPEGVYAMLGVTPSEEDLKTFQLAAEAREKKIVRTLSDEVIASGAEKVEKLRPKVMPGSFKDTAGMATQSALTNLLFLAPGLWMGRGVTLAGMGSQAFGRSYLEQREGGSSPATAMAAGAVTGASEILTEFIPVGIYLKPRASFVRSLAAAELTEIPTETVNQIVNDVTDKVTIRPDMTVEDAIENIMTTIQVTALSTPGISGITYSANKALGRSLLRSDYADTFDQAKNAALMDGATPQEAVTAGIEAVRETPEGAEYIKQKVEELKRAASEYKAPESKQPFILGVSEDANGDVTSFTMADPVTGQTFDVPAQRSEDRDTLNVTPDMQAVNEKIKEIRAIDQDDAALDKLIQGNEDIDQAAGHLFNEPAKTMPNNNKSEDVTNLSRSVTGDDVLDFEDDAKPETVLDRVKAINDRIGEKGSVDIGPLVDLGRSIWAEGHQSIEAFTARAKELLADVWDKVQYHIQAAWKILNNERGSVSMEPMTTPKGTGNIPPETTPKPVGGKYYAAYPTNQWIIFQDGNVITRTGLSFKDKAKVDDEVGRLNKIRIDSLPVKKNPSTSDEIRQQSILDIPGYGKPGFSIINKDNILNVRSASAKIKIAIDELLPSLAENEYFVLRGDYNDSVARKFRRSGNYVDDVRRGTLHGTSVVDLPDNPTARDVETAVYKALSYGPNIYLIKAKGQSRAGNDFWNDEIIVPSHTIAGKPIDAVSETIDYDLIKKYFYPETTPAPEAGAAHRPVRPESKQLPNPTRPPEVGGHTLYSGVDPTQVIPVLKSLTENLKEAWPHLEALGLKAYESGKATYSAWSAEMKSYLGDLWESFKGSMAQLWESVKAFNESLGERGSFSTKKKASEYDVDDVNELLDMAARQDRASGELPESPTYDDVRKKAAEMAWEKISKKIDFQKRRENSAMRKQAMDDARTLPAFQSMNYIIENGGLDRAKLLKDYGKETVDELSRRRIGLIREGGKLEHDVVADQMGYNSGDDMINDILDWRGLEEEAKKRAEEFEYRYSDLITSAELDNFNELLIAEEDKIMSKLTAENRPKPAKGLKTFIRQKTGQAQPKDRLVTEYDALAEAFRKEARTSREAFRAGKKGEVEKSKEKMRWLMRRRESLKNVRDYFGLTDAELMSATKRRNVGLMDDAEFKQFLRNVELKAVELAETRQEKMALLKLIEEKRLKKVDNYRKALELPTFNDMTAQQLRDFAKLLEPFQEDDVFLTQRELETVDRTDLRGIKTLREARERLAKEAGVDVEELNKVHVEALDSFRWDSALRERDPFFDILVSRMTEATMGAELRTHEIENKAYELAKKSEKSRNLGIVEKMVPQDDLIMAFLESPMDRKAAIVEQMTPEQINYANFMQSYFAEALNYLIATKSLERGRENYFVHIRKTFLENLKDGGLKKAVSEIFKSYQQDQMMFNILDDDTGNILPLEKFFQFSLQRTDVMDPTRNVTKAFLTYMRTFEKKKMFDAIIPKLDIYAQSLTPTRYTPRGLEIDRSLKTFVNTWINNKKGRRISFNSTIRQGGPLDVGIRALRTFTTILDLGLSPVAQVAALAGEQVTNAAMLGNKGMAQGSARLATDKGKRIIEKYRSFVGRSLWEEFTAPGKEIQERLSQVLFSGFHASSVTANKQFLLASMTEQEFDAETISTERLAQMQLDMGRFRVVPGTGSIVGSTSVGDAAMQYKKWAVPFARTLYADGKALYNSIGKKKAGEVWNMKETQELMRFAYFSAAVFIVGAMAGADDQEDKSFLGKAKFRLYRESMSLMQGVDPELWFTPFRTTTWLLQVAQALKSMVLLETYKSGDKEGELKGDDKLKRQFVPGVVRSVASED